MSLPLFLHWICLVPYAFLAWQILLRFGPWKNIYPFIPFTLALAATLTVLETILLGHLFHDLISSLWVGALISFCLGSLLAIRGKGQAMPSFQHSFPRTGWIFVLWYLFLTLLVAWVAWKFDYHDQRRTQVHPALIESMLRGNFPPHLQVFPEMALKYHFGADIFVAILGYITGLSGVKAINVLQVMGWILTLSGGYFTCRQLGMGRLASFLTPHWAFLSGGWFYLLNPWVDTAVANNNAALIWPMGYPIFQRHLNPGVISWFFQTPYSLGFPVFLTFVSLLHRGWQKNRLQLWAVLGLLLGSLSVIQVALFFTAWLGSLTALVWIKFRRETSWLQWLLSSLLLGGISLGTSLLLGGFFERSPLFSSGNLVFQWPPGYLAHALHAGTRIIKTGEAMLWYVGSFGSLCWLVPLVLLGTIRQLRKEWGSAILFFAVMAVVSFMLPQFFLYRLSYDIIKWFCIFQVASPFWIMLVVSHWEVRKFYLFLILIPLIFLDTLPSVRQLYGLAFLGPSHYPGKEKTYWLEVIRPPGPEFRLVLERLRKTSWDETVLSTENLSYEISIQSGQSVAIPDFNTGAFGVQPELLKTRNEMIRKLQQNFSIGRLESSRISWIVFPCDEFERSFSEISRNTLRESARQGAIEYISVGAGNGCFELFHLPRRKGEN